MSQYCYWSSIVYFLAPTAGPSNFQVLNTSSTSLAATWDPPHQNETHGIIRKYSVRYREVICGSTWENLTSWTLININSAVRFAEIKELTKWSCYAVQVNAATVKDGKWSGEIICRTSEDGKMICCSSFYYVTTASGRKSSRKFC